MKIGRLNRASFAKTARRAMFLFAFAALGTQAVAGTVSVSYELNGKTESFSGATLREVNDKMRTYWEVGDGCAYNAEKLPADGTGTLTWTVSGTVEQGDYLNEGALVLPSLSGGYIYRDGTYRWKKIEVKAAAPGATINSNPTFDVWHSYFSMGTDTTTVTGVTLQGGLYVVPHGTVTFDGCTFTGQLRVPNGDGAFAVTGCTFTGTTAAQDSNGYVMHYQAAGKLAFTGNTVADGYRRGLNIDNEDLTATVERNKLGTTADAGRSAIQISTCVKLAVTGNEIKLNGGNAFTFHEALLGLSAAPEVSISGNTVTGTGYLVYDDAVASGKAFTSDNLKLTYAADNVVAATIDTTQGVKGTTKHKLSGTVATTLHSVDFAAFVKALTDAGYTFDGSTHARAQNGKLTVKWSPVSGCYDTRAGHECTVGNVAATANTPKRVNSGLTQFQLFEGSSHAVNVKNVAFVYEPAAFTVCENSGWKGTFTAEKAPAGQIYLMNTGDVTFEGCSFDKVVLTSFNCTGTSTVKNCSFKNVYNSYAVKDIRGKKVAVTGCTFEDCGAAVMVSSTVKVEEVTISGNTFKNVDVKGTTPDNKVGTRGLVQIASSGDYAGTAFDFSGNKAEACGPVLRQLNETVSFDADDKTNLGKLVSDGGASTFYTDDTFVAQVGDTKYATLAEAITDVQNGETIVVNAGEYKLNGNLTYTGKAFKIQAAKDAKVSFDMSAAVALHDAKITFSGVTFDYKTNKDYIGLQHADTLVYNDCTVNGKVFLYAASETFNRCTFTQTVVDYNVWTYGAKAVTFNGCTFNCVGKSVLVYNEGSIPKTELAVSDCEFKASAPVEGKAAIEIDTSLMAGGATITVDAKTTAEGFAEGSNSKSTLWNDKKQKQDTNKNTTVTVAGETVFTPIVAQVGEKTYTTLAAALADVAEGKPLTWVAEGSWPVKTPVYYNGTFYETGTGFAAKGALERAIDAANAEGAAAVAKIYVRPGFEADELVLQAHQQLKTGLAIYGNDAKLSRNWAPCVEYPGTSGDSGAHQLTKDVSLAIYNLHNGAGFWGRRTTAYTVDLKLSGCRNAYQVMFYGNADTGVKGKTNISVTNCTFDATTKADHNVLVTIGAGTVDVSDTTFTAANINVKNVDGGDNVITVKNCTFKDTVAGNQNIRVRSYVEGTHADLTIENVTFAGDSTQNVEIGDSKAECKGVVNYTITKTSGTMNVYKQGVTTAEATTLDAAVAYSGDNVGTIADEKALRRAFFAAPTDGTAVTVTLGADITLETLYAAENFGTEKLDDNAEGDTFNRYKVGVHPTEEDPNHWNPLVTGQTQEQRLVYGAYYHMSATDERIARLVVKAGQKIVLDLNGHTIQKNARATHGDWSTVCTDIIGNYGTLEIKDSSTGTKGTIKGIGYISCQGAVLHNYAGATMTVTGVNVDGNAAGMEKGTGQYVVSNEGGTLTLDGVNVHDTATSASLIMSNGGTVTIKNATLSHPATKVINAKGGEINIESASVTSEEYAVFVTGDARVNVNGSLTIEGTGTLCVEGDAAALTKKPGVELSAPAGFTWVENDGVQVLKSFAAKVGKTEYMTLAEAIAVLSAENHTLTLLNENAWDATTPVYWAAGAQSGYAATLTEALTAAYKADAGAITVVCRPGADVGEMTHGHVADDLTIYGNDAYLSGGECDLEVDTYTFSRATGKQATDGVCLDKDITITAYELDNLGVWGQRHTAHKVTVNLTDCDGKALEGKTNLQRVYISGTTGVNDITLTDCDFLTKATAVYSNADGAIKAVKCSFTGGEVPFNINHKANGTQTVAVENCTFTNCGDAGDWKQFAAPLRLVNSGTGTQSAEVTGCAFAGTVGANGDILLGDGRTGQASNDVELKVVDTAANIQAQKPGYYNGETVDETKKATATSLASGTLETSVAKLLPVNDGSEAHPYSREQFAAMTRADYITAQERLGGTLYVNVGDYAYGKNGVLGNGVRNDTTGQVPDHSKLNAYGENGYLGEKNDGANGHAVVFVGGTITSGVTGYKDIDNIGTSLLLAVPAYTKVTFKETTFKNVLSFDYQLYTSPWSQLGGLTFNGCTFDGIIVGAIASQELAFNGCTFNNYVNTTSANSSNPTWIRPAYGNWTKGDNEGQGTGFRSLTKITFENNTVTSTRPVKFERIAQWEMSTTVTATNNTFAITPQAGDTSPKNVGLYFGANAKFDLVIDKNAKSDETAALYTAEYKAPTDVTYVGLPAGSTVKNAAGEEVPTGDGDALAWKTTKKITLKTTTEVASVTNATGVSVNFATLSEAVKAAQAGETVTLLADITLTSKQSISKELTLDLNGKTLTGTALRTLFLGSGANVTIQDSSAGKTGKVANGYKGRADPYTICLDGSSAAALTLVSGTVEANPHKTDLQSVAINTNHEKDGPYAINIKGGKVFVPESSTNGRAIVAGKNVTLTVEGGEIVGGLHGVDVYDGSKTAITGGSISARVVDPGKAAYGLRATGTAIVTIGAADGTADGVSVAGIMMNDNGYKLDVPAVTVNSGTIAGPVYSITPGTIVFNVQATSEDVLRFADDTAAKFLPSNLELRAKDIDGKTMYYVAAKPVAAIGTVGYETLEAALAAAKDGETVKLLADVTVAEQLVAEKALTLDLGGKAVTSTYANGGYAFLTRAAVTVKNGTFAAGQARALSAYANLTLEDATITSELAGGNCCVAFSAANCVYTVVNTKIVGAYAIANFAHNATIAITGSTLEGSGCGLYHNGSNYGLKLTVSDTTINGAIDQAIGEGKDPSGVYLSGSSVAIANAANQNGAHGRHQATFTRCTIKGNTGVEVKYTDLTLEDCTVVATTKEPSYTQNNNGMAALGFAVVSTDNATGNATPKPEGTITITGADGSYTGLVGLGSLDSVKTGFADFEDAHYAVSGGTFSNAVLPEYCAAGFIPTANDDGTYGVKAGAYVAAIGTTGYETLEAALAAADAGATVKMLADVVLTEKQTIAKALVLDLNGKTISSTVDEFITIVSGGNLTIDDATNEGRIENTATSGSAIRIETGTVTGTVGGILTLTGGSILAHSSNDAAVYSQSRGGEKVTVSIKGGRIENDGTNSYAVKLGSNTGTINVTGGEIVGGQYGLYVFAGNVVNISGGTIRGNTGNAVYSGAQNKITISGGTLTPGGTAAALAIGGGSIGPQSCTVTVGREGGTVADVTIPSIDFKPGFSANMATVNLLSGIVQKFLNFDKMTVEKVSQGKDKLLVGTDITACLPGSDLLCQLDAASGLYEIVKLTVENAAAIVTHDDVETPYHTVEQACKAVTDGDTLTLKVDHTGSQTLSFSAKNVTVDLGGKTLTYTGATGGLSSALSFNQSTASDNIVTVKNGTIVANAQDATCVRAEMTGDLSKTLTVVFGENLTLTSGNTSRYGGVVFGTGTRTASPCEKMTKGGLLVTEGEKVWIYGETATAFTHAKGSEVTLLNDWYDTDTKGTVKVPSSGTFASAKLNLNGHTISSYGVNPAVLMGMVGENEDTAAKTLEISSGTIKTFRHGAAVCGSNKTLTLDGVTLTTTGDKMYGLYANGTTSGNTVTLKNKSAVLSEKATGIYFPGAGTLTVEDSNVTGGVSGIEVRAGVLNVSGTSVIASTAMEFSFTNNDNGITTTGAAVAAVKHTVGNDLAVTITGGTFKGPRGFYANDPNVAKPGTVTVSISGGVFSTDVEKKYLADGCKTVQQTIDGTLYYVVGPAITQIGVTLGGEKKEMPFTDAWLADNIGADASSWTTAALEEKAANGLAKWQCYLFGLDPSKEDAKVVATAGQGTDEAIPLTVANADASASPLVTGGYVTVAYVLMGSNDRTAWTQVVTFNKRDDLAIPLTGTPYKFYRVDVTVTSAEGN